MFTTSRNATACNSPGCEPRVDVPIHGAPVATRRQAMTDVKKHRRLHRDRTGAKQRFRPNPSFHHSVPTMGHLPSRCDSRTIRCRGSHGLASVASACRRFATWMLIARKDAEKMPVLSSPFVSFFPCSFSRVCRPIGVRSRERLRRQSTQRRRHRHRGVLSRRGWGIVRPSSGAVRGLTSETMNGNHDRVPVSVHDTTARRRFVSRARLPAGGQHPRESRGCRAGSAARVASGAPSVEGLRR